MLFTECENLFSSKIYSFPPYKLLLLNLEGELKRYKDKFFYAVKFS